MKVVVFGAGGRTGRAVVERARSAGHQVTAFVQHAAELDLPGVTVREGDAQDIASVDQAVAGQDAVIDTIGGKTPYKKDTDLESTAAATIIRAMQREGVRRLVVTSMVGVGDSTPNTPLYSRLLVSTFLRGAKADKAEMEQEAEDSGLDWVIVRPGILTDGPATGQVRTFEPGDEGQAHKISREDVARFLVDQLTDDAHLGRPVTIATS